MAQGTNGREVVATVAESSIGTLGDADELNRRRMKHSRPIAEDHAANIDGNGPAQESGSADEVIGLPRPPCVKLLRSLDKDDAHSAGTATWSEHNRTALQVTDQTPTVLVFVPSVDGISHNEREFTTDDDMLAGVDVFTRVVAGLADGALDEPGAA